MSLPFVGPQVEVTQQIVVASTTAVQSYTVPLGNFVADIAGQSTLEVDMGGGFVPCVFGVDYQHYRRSSPGTPATIADAAIGFTYLAAPVAPGWSFRFRWSEPRILTPPIAIAKVMVPANYTIFWNANTGGTPPNGVCVPMFPNSCVEFWRQTFRSGGARHTGGGPPNRIGMGRRYLPYFRGGLGVVVFSVSDFQSGQGRKRNHYKVCYYNPITGGRSPLSTDTIVVCSSGPADAVNGRIPVRAAGSVWIE